MHANADLGGAADQKQHAVECHGEDGRKQREEQRNEAQNDKQRSEGGDGSPLRLKPLNRCAEAVRAVPTFDMALPLTRIAQR